MPNHGSSELTIIWSFKIDPMFTKSKTEVVHRQNNSVPVLLGRDMVINMNAVGKGTVKRTTPAAGLPLPAVAPFTLSFEKWKASLERSEMNF